MDVFISWTGTDREVKDVLAERLESAGITCWDSDKFCTSDYAEECTAAIRRCGVFIAIISDASMEKGFVQNEVTTARTLEREGKLNILVYKITDKPYTDAFEFLLNHISFVTGNLVQRGESALDILVNRTKTLLRKRKEGDPEKPFEVHIPQIDGLKIAKTGYFVEGSREESLQSIADSLNTSNVLILTEFFGYGKRSTIKKFVETHAEQYHTAVFIPNKCNSLREFFLAGLEFTNINPKSFEDLQGDALLRAKFKVLEKLDAGTLLVIPDVKLEMPDAFLCELLGSLQCRIILLTQESADAYMDWFPVMPIGRMRDEHLYTLFFHYYVRAFEEEQEALREPLSRFFSNIGGHTKTVELTAATLNRDLAVSPEDIPQYLSMQGSEGLQMKERIIRQIESVFDVDKLESDEITALLVAAYLALPYISAKSYGAVLESCGVRDWKMVEDLDKRRWLDVDIQNRTVSMEPLVAQIVLTKFGENYEIANRCQDYLVDACGKLLSISTSESTLYRGLSKMQYFFSVVGLPECARILELLVEKSIAGDAFEPKKMSEAVEMLEAKYPVTITDGEEELSQWEELELGAVCYIRQILPLAKLISKDLQGLYMDFSANGNRMLLNAETDNIGTANMEEIFGISYEECMTMLESLRKETWEWDEDGYESFVLMECFAMLDSLMKRDIPAVLVGMESLLGQVAQYPEILSSEECSDTVFAVFLMLGRTYIASSAYSSAIMLCEKLLSYPMPQLKKASVLNLYVTALRSQGLFTEVLYSTYEELLENYDKFGKDVFDTRADMQGEKKILLLQYTRDLVRGDRLDEAARRFADGWKLQECSLPDLEAKTAEVVVDALIKNGRFDQAVEFISTYFDRRTVKNFMEQGDENTQQIIQTFLVYQSTVTDEADDFAKTEDPRKYVSYYQAFSRKNNGLLERKYLSVADQTLDFDFSDWTDEELHDHVNQLQKRAKREKILQLAPEAFALVSEVGYRILGYRHHYVQYMGAAAMADGKIAEILNGEGKTYTIVLTAFLQWLYGKQVYVIDQSPYLTGRNYNWMQGIYRFLGVDCQYATKQEELPQSTADVIYTDLNTLVFGFLHYELDYKYHRRDLRLDCVIVDEIDTTLVDSAEQPFIVVSSQRDENRVKMYETAWHLARDVVSEETYYTYTRGNVVLNPAIYPLIENRFGVTYGDVSNLDTLRQIESAVAAGILCCGYYVNGQHYHIFNGVPVLENKEKGVFEPIGVTYRYFLCKENDLDTRKVEKELSVDKKVTNCTCIRDLFRKFRFVCGTTATAVSFRNEFQEIYNLDYVAVPPHNPCIREDRQSPLYLSLRAKEQAIMELVQEKSETGQPILIVAQSVAESERYSRLLKRNGIEHNLLNAKNSDDYAGIVSWAGIPGSVLVTNALAGRGADIKLGGDPELCTRRELAELGEDVGALDRFVYTMPTREQMESPLYQKYYGLLEKNKALCNSRRQSVVQAGGLCVIGTSFFPEPRTEQQTRGRSGRQGQVGESWVFRSVEDDGLKFMLSSSVMEWALANCDGMDEIDTPVLHKSLKVSQQKLHDKKFARIRKQNGVSRYLEMARPDFMGKRFDLVDGIITIDDWLEEWASDKFVLQNLHALQKGEDCQIPLLKNLWKRYEILKTAKGGRSTMVLMDVLRDEMKRIFAGYDYLTTDGVIHAACMLLLEQWKEYIAIVNNTADKVTMKEHVMERYLQEEKNRLCRKAVENMLKVKVRKPNT